MTEIVYNRARAVRYAHKWAYDRNPAYAKFDSDGGDCTNFTSQCLYAGCRVMNRRDWYYNNVNDRAPAWTGVVQLHKFLINNQGAGPYAAEVEPREILPGDLIQMRYKEGERYRHTVIVVETGDEGRLDQILVAAHSFNADNRALSSYTFVELRFLHILGARRL